MSLLTPERLRSLAAAAVAAPSADNQHVIRLAARGNGLQLIATQELLDASASRRILGLISAGAVAENLMLRARRLGLQLEPRWSLANGRQALLAEFTCRETPAQSDMLEQAIELRHTNRNLRFTGPQLPLDSQETLSGDVAQVEGAQLHWLDEPSRRRLALRLIRSAESERFRSRALHRELFASIRFDVGWNASASHGLPPASLELPWFERPAFSLLRHWSVQRIANLAGAHHFLGFRAAYLPCRLAPHLGAIAVEGDSEKACVDAGRALQRVWLRATTHHLALQVFAASALFSRDGLLDIPERLRRELQSAWDRLCPGARPWVVFRLGRARPATTRAGRPVPETLIQRI